MRLKNGEGVWGRGGLGIGPGRRLADDGKRSEVQRRTVDVAEALQNVKIGRGSGEGGLEIATERRLADLFRPYFFCTGIAFGSFLEKIRILD